MEPFSDASSYCQHLKYLSNQLSNVRTPVSNERLVLQLISGLTNVHDTVGSQIHHNDYRLPFYKACSVIILEDTARAKKAVSTTNNTVFITSYINPSTPTPSNRNGGNNNHGR